MVHRPRYNDWSLPKGKLDSKESFQQAAIREVEEETGYTCGVITKVGSIAYQTPRRNPKLVRYWLLEAERGSFKPNREVDRVVWLTANKAQKVLSYTRDRAVLGWAHALTREPQSGRVFLVRHADAGSRDKWTKKDSQRPLSKKGRQQANALTNQLTRIPVTRVYSSGSKRAEQTVSELARVLAFKLRKDSALREGSAGDTLHDRISEVRNDSLVMCSHGDVIGSYIEALAADGVALKGGTKWQKGSVWRLELSKGEVRKGFYTPPRR